MDQSASCDPLHRHRGRIGFALWGSLFATCVGLLWAVPGSSAAAASRSTPSWPSLQGGPTHAGEAEHLGPAPALRQTWRTGAAGDARLSAVALQPTVGVSVGRTTVVGFDPSTGAVLWTVERTAGPIVPPAIDSAGGRAVFTEGNGPGESELVAVDLQTRQRDWKVALTDLTRSAPTIADGFAYVGARDGSVYAVEASTGQVRWRRRVTGEVDDAPAVSGGRVFVVGEEQRTGRTTLYALDASSGRSRWSYSPPRASLGVSSPTVAGNTVYVGFGDVTVRAFDVRSGALRWDQPVRGLFSPLSTLAAAGGSVYALDGDGGVYRFDAATGRRQWDYQFPTFVSWSSPLVTDAVIYVGLDDGTLAALSRATGHLVWETRLPFGPIGALTPAGDLLLVPAIGATGGVVAFRHDPRGVLRDVPSPTQVKVLEGLFNYALAFAAVSVLVLALFRSAAGRRPGPHDGAAPTTGQSVGTGAA